MSEVRSTYDTGLALDYGAGIQLSSPPSAETRLLLMTVRQAMLMIVAGIEKYLGIAPKR